MSTVVTTNKRPSADVAFYPPAPEYLAYINDTYVASGRLTINSDFDPESNSVTLELVFATESDKESYFNDPVVAAEKAKKIEYNKANGIV
jgi:hypothetical protein